MRINVPGVPHATARRLLRRPGLWYFPALVVIAVSVVVSLAYIGGIINPTGNLHRFPMSVVDEDQGVHTGGRTVNLGPQITHGITTADSRQRVAWRTMSLGQVEAEMDKDSVYGALIIPANFSSSVLALTKPGVPHGAVPQQPTLQLLTNPRSGSVATSLAQAIGEQTSQAVSSRIAATLAESLKLPKHTSRQAIPAAEEILLAHPVTLHTIEHRPVSDHSGLGLSAFYVSLVLTLGAYVGAGVVSGAVDFALGYQTSERGRRWSSRLPLPVTRTQTLIAKTAMSAVLSVASATAVLLTCRFILHMDTPHFGQLWIYSICASIAVGVSTQAIISLIGGLGSLVGMLFFVALAVPSSGGSFPLQTVPRPYRWLADFEPMRQINDGARAILYFDARADAGLARGWLMIAVGSVLGLALGLIVALIRDRRGHQRLTRHQIHSVHADFHSGGSVPPPADPVAIAQHRATARHARPAVTTAQRDVTTTAPSPHAVPHVFGRVRNSYGDAVPMAAVTLLSLNGRQLGRATTHSDGSYEFDGPGSGSCLLLAGAASYQPQASIVQIGQGPLFHEVVLNRTVPV